LKIVSELAAAFKKLEARLKPHVDILLMALAILVLVLALFRSWGSKAIVEASAPTLVFTQWWQNELEPGTLEALIEEFEALHP
jgi:multiple sugar transport system substrate-binding protein